jgi:hypothetical protein
MAHFTTTLETKARAVDAFSYLADFSNARHWDPTVTDARRIGHRPIGEGSRFEIELGTRLRPIRLTYTLTRYEPYRLIMLEAATPLFRSLDTIEIEERSSGARIHYDADLRPHGAVVLLDLPMHLMFQLSGRRSAQGLARALDGLATNNAPKRARRKRAGAAKSPRHARSATG